jgi:hypothetical protein
MQRREWRLLAKAAIAIAAIKLLVNLFSFKTQPTAALHVPTVAYAITLTRIPAGLEGQTALDAAEVSQHHLEAMNAANALRKVRC